ncbi:uncharacterized protein LOC118430130 [Branchiostoma floridae]|uniref:Uncharacterized protein LOC118430130 n=1 Tax=Branchiostoma floridae TaxID=7739 RepID=A0A9J7M8S8_BRAFL|nr:uncharacterized protein LOC118430130 [Branchiostoma floridae]
MFRLSCLRCRGLSATKHHHHRYHIASCDQDSMASHIVCHGNEHLPRSFPPPLPSAKDHGIVSQLGKDHLLSQTEPKVQVQEADIIPMHIVPAPVPKSDINLADPDLLVTPEKRDGKLKDVVSVRPKSYPYIVKEPRVERHMPGLRRVRFDVADSVSEGSDQSEEDSEVTFQRTRVVRSGQPKVQVSRHRKAVQGRCVVGTNAAEECVLARPEFNTTLALGKELQALNIIIVRHALNILHVSSYCPQKLNFGEFDAKAAALEKLKTSEQVQEKVSEKSAEGVNIAPAEQKYRDLVSLDVPVQSVLEAAVEEKLSMVKDVRHERPQVQEEPDIMDFFTDDLMFESADYSTTHIPPVTASLQTAPPHMTFDLYRHMQMWEG